MLPDLVRHLLAIDWPRSRLDIKLIVEAHDPDTIAAAESASAGTCMEVVVVPSGEPLTKPKAMAFAMRSAIGAYVVVYDAEDRPHPGQLREAHARFRREPDIGCLQAPLLVDNRQEGWLARMFAIEYAQLFDGLKPALAHWGFPVPLGGTSNHFRRSELERALGWDPYNVTEDADLGIRLARYGTRTATLEAPTWEEAPVRAGAWMRQRTRWFKGWLQTWAVHMRHPLRLALDLGWARFLAFHALFTGMIVSAFVHPFILMKVAITLPDLAGYLMALDGVGAALNYLDTVNLLVAYLAYALLATLCLHHRGRRRYAVWLVTLPAYWLMMSLAAWLALIDLVRRPHYWSKTTHGEARMRIPAQALSRHTASEES